MLLGDSTGLGESEWLLSVPVVSSGGDGETGIWVDKWILGGRFLLGEGKWFLSIPVISGGGNGEASIWMNEWVFSLLLGLG